MNLLHLVFSSFQYAFSCYNQLSTLNQGPISTALLLSRKTGWEVEYRIFHLSNNDVEEISDDSCPQIRRKEVIPCDRIVLVHPNRRRDDALVYNVPLQNHIDSISPLEHRDQVYRTRAGHAYLCHQPINPIIHHPHKHRSSLDQHILREKWKSRIHKVSRAIRLRSDRRRNHKVLVQDLAITGDVAEIEKRRTERAVERLVCADQLIGWRVVETAGCDVGDVCIPELELALTLELVMLRGG